MTQPVFLNGRFLSQSVTGVQRFSGEIAAAIDRLMLCGEWPETTVLTPRPLGSAGRDPASSFRQLRVRDVGHRRGHLWEQTDLAKAARGGTLVSLEILFGGEWREIALLRTNRRGAFAYRYTFAAIGPATYRFRAQLPHTIGYPFASGASRSSYIHLTG